MASPKNENLGKYIVIEGPEGSGKTSVTKKVVGKLKENDYKVFLFREPGGTIVSEEIRDILLKVRKDNFDAPLPWTEVLLYFAARYQLVNTKVIPLLESGVSVVSVRSYYSTYAIQGGGRAIPMDDLVKIKKLTIGELEPDLIVLMDVPVDVGIKRKNDQEEITRFELEDEKLHIDVREAYLKMYEDDKKNGRGHMWFYSDTKKNFDDVVDDVYKGIEAILK